MVLNTYAGWLPVHKVLREKKGETRLRACLGREKGKTLAVSEGHLKMLSPAVGRQEKGAVLLCAEKYQCVHFPWLEDSGTRDQRG